MNLRQQITPKNDDGSIDHRYVPIAKAIAEHAGERVEAQLRKLYVETNKLEKESATAHCTSASHSGWCVTCYSSAT